MNPVSNWRNRMPLAQQRDGFFRQRRLFLAFTVESMPMIFSHRIGEVIL